MRTPTAYSTGDSSAVAYRVVRGSSHILLEGTPKEISSDPRVREVYLGGAHHHG